MQLFTSFLDHVHTGVIQFNWAVRIHVVQQCDLFLTDYTCFAELEVGVPALKQVTMRDRENSLDHATAMLSSGGMKGDAQTPLQLVPMLMSA